MSPIIKTGIAADVLPLQHQLQAVNAAVQSLRQAVPGDGDIMGTMQWLQLQQFSDIAVLGPISPSEYIPEYIPLKVFQ